MHDAVPFARGFLLQVLAHAGPQVLQRRELPEGLRERVVQLREVGPAHRLQLDAHAPLLCWLDGFAPLGVTGRAAGDHELSGAPDLERADRLLHIGHHLIPPEGDIVGAGFALAAVVVQRGDGHHRGVTVRRRPLLDCFPLGPLVAQAIDDPVDLFVLDRDRRPPDPEAAGAGEFDLGSHVELHVEREVGPVVVLDAAHRRLADRLEPVLGERLPVGPVDGTLHHAVADRLAVVPLQHGRRDVALAETGEAHGLRDGARHGFALAGHAFRRNGDGELARPRPRLVDGYRQIRCGQSSSMRPAGAPDRLRAGPVRPRRDAPEGMRKGGLEPPRASPRDPKSRASTNSATFASLSLKGNTPTARSHQPMGASGRGSDLLAAAPPFSATC